MKEILVVKFISPKIKIFQNAISVGDILEKNYGKLVKPVAGVFGILSAQVLAIVDVFNLFLAVSPTVGSLLGSAIVIIYSTLSGMMAVVKADIIRFIIPGAGLPLTLFFEINACGGWVMCSARFLLLI